MCLHSNLKSLKKMIIRPTSFRIIHSLGMLLVAWGAQAAPAAIPTSLFNPGYVVGDCNYHSLTAASDGKVYFTVSTHNHQSSARIYRFDPASETITQLGDLSDILGIDPQQQVTQGKIHTPMIELEGYLYFASHTAFYADSLPNMNPKNGREPYSGGHFLRLHLATGTIEDLVQLQLPNEGIISMTVDPVHKTLFGLTWPTGLLISYNLEEKRLKNWGAVEQRGEWGRLPEEWNFICRTLGVDDQGTVYGANDRGQIWQFECDVPRPVKYLKNLDLTAVPPVQEADFEIPAQPQYFLNTWRTIDWNPKTQSFWGIQGGSTQLFEFSPASGTLRSVHTMRPEGIPVNTRRNPERSQLGFMLGPNNTLFYLAHAPRDADTERRRRGTSVHLVTYQIDTDTYKDQGILTTDQDHQIFFTESITIGADDHIYTVAWVRVTDPARVKEVQAARTRGAPAETASSVYEIQLVRLPQWQTFVP